MLYAIYVLSSAFIPISNYSKSFSKFNFKKIKTNLHRIDVDNIMNCQPILVLSNNNAKYLGNQKYLCYEYAKPYKFWQSYMLPTKFWS